MVEWLSTWIPSWLAVFVVSSIASFWGVATRLNHAARRDGQRVQWRDYVFEIPTMMGMAIIAGPIGRYLSSNYGVDVEIMFALCYLFGYVGARMFDRVVALMDKFISKKVGDDENSN